MNRSIYIVGFPESGKTTYLAALWHLLNSNADLQFKLDKLSGERTYLNSIAELWRTCTPVGRTSLSVRENISVQLKAKADGQVLSLEIPDLSGESFEQVFANRKLGKEDELAISECCGLLLFTSADRSITGVLIDNMENGYSETDSEHFVETEWTCELVQEQVRLVDFLQTCGSLLDQTRVMRISILVSAWDVVESSSLSPSDWLDKNLPLLAQVLRNTRSNFEFHVFGVSAQGAAFDDTLSEAHAEKDPSDRIEVLHNGASSNDLSAPIAWLLS